MSGATMSVGDPGFSLGAANSYTRPVEEAKHASNRRDALHPDIAKGISMQLSLKGLHGDAPGFANCKDTASS